MTTCLDIIRRALRLSAGETGTPTGSDAQDAMAALQSVILELPGFIHNARWREKAVSTAYTAYEGQRITVTSPGVVTLPTTIDTLSADYCAPLYYPDDWDPCVTTRPPMDLARVQILGADVANAGIWLYSATNGSWRRADGLTTAGDFPFGQEDEAGLAAQLAIHMVDEYGGEVSAATVQRANASKASLRSRFKKSVCCEPRFRDYV
jgi:hypothetical protein